jgi:RNA polymerase sigma-70 factor (sigma-E family)
MRHHAEAVPIKGDLLEELYVRHATEAQRLAFLLLGDRSLAEDVVHDAFVRLAGRFLYLRDPGGFHAYLRTTVINLVRSKQRRRQVEQRYLARRSLEPGGIVEAADLGEREVLRDALLALPIRQRTAVILRYYEDLTDVEAASVMRCSPGTVKSLASRGVAKLRTSIEVDDRG